jgi:hypothetical protein
MRRILPLMMMAVSPTIASAERLEQIGVSSNGALLYLDRDSMRTNRPIVGQRPFEAIQIWAIYDLQGVRRDPARGERALYSFDCLHRTSNTLAYQKYKANGARMHDWKAADFDFKYEPVKSGTLTEQAMLYVCNGGKMPAPIQDSSGLVRVDDDNSDPDGVAQPPKNH